MVLELSEAVEPEIRDLREDRPLVRDAGRQHDVERGDAIGGDEEVAVAEVVDVAHFAAAREGEGEVGLGDRCAHGAAIIGGRASSPLLPGIVPGSSSREDAAAAPEEAPGRMPVAGGLEARPPLFLTLRLATRARCARGA